MHVLMQNKKIDMTDNDIYCHVWISDDRIALTFDDWVELDQTLLHSLDGPAVVFCHDKTKQWWVDGRPHRLDGPAIEWAEGPAEWMINGKDLSTKEVKQWIKKNSVDLSTIEGQMAFKLMWM